MDLKLSQNMLLELSCVHDHVNAKSAGIISWKTIEIFGFGYHSDKLPISSPWFVVKHCKRNLFLQTCSNEILG